MKSVGPLFALLFPLFLTLPAAPAAGERPARASFDIVALDPGAKATLAASERLYLRIRYESPVPIRFTVAAFRQETLAEGAFTSSTPPYDAGRGEALAWIGFAHPLRIDELRLTAYDYEWQELGSRITAVTATWEERDGASPGEPAGWVEALLKQHRHVFDNTFDPQPKKPRPLFDLFFLLSFMAIPFYLMMQAQMLIRYRGQWQWYAAAPLLPIIPLSLYSLLGLGLGTALWVVFLFRYMAVALLYLLILWTVKRMKSKGLRMPPPLRNEDSAAGTE